MNSVELKDKIATLKSEAYDIIERCKTEIRDMNEEESAEIERIKDEIRQCNEELENLEKDYDTQTEENQEDNKEKKENRMAEFRLLKAINAIANNKQMDDAERAVIENGGKEMRSCGVTYEGQIQIPVGETCAAITVTTEHDDTVGVDVYDFMAPLRAKNVLVQAGAKFLTGLQGDLLIPIMGASNVYWEGEITEHTTDGGGGFTSKKFSPLRLTTYVDVSKQFLNQTSADAEAMLRNDIVSAISTKLESTILGSADKTTTQPAGIFYSAQPLTTISTFADICNLESDVEDANVMGECKYIMSNKAKAALRNMAKSAKSTELVMQNGQIDGTDVLNTSNVGSKNVAFGDWSNLVICQYGGLDILVDNYTQATKGLVRIVINAYFDAKVLRDNAIAVATVA